MAERGRAGLKSPGEETGVLLAVRGGMCDGGGGGGGRMP